MHTPSPAYETPVIASRDPVARSSGLIDRLETTRQGMARFENARCLLRVSLIVGTLMGLLAAADWMWVLGTGVRAGGLSAIILLAAFLLCRGLLASGHRFGRQDAAEEVESAFPQLGQRVRTTLQYSEPIPDNAPASPELVHALAEDTGRRTAAVDFQRLIPWKSLRALQAGLVGLVAVFAVGLCFNGELRTAALRTLLLPVHYTQLHVKPGDQTLKVGGNLEIEAIVSGRPVANVDLTYRPLGTNEEWTRISLAPADLPADSSPRLLGNFATTLRECGKDLEYRVSAGPIESPVYRLTILHPLLVKKFEATIQPPSYTRRPAAKVKEKDFKVIAGSSVFVEITLDRAPVTAKLLLYPAGNAAKSAGPIAPVALKIHDNVLSGEVTGIDKELEYEIVAEASDGMRLEPVRYRIGVLPDRKPTIRFVKPAEQIEVTPTTEVRMKVEAGDDFGLSKVGIVYQVGNGEKKTLYLDSDPKQPLSAKIMATLPLEEHALGFQDSLTYFAFAEDNHPTRPQRSTTDLQFIDIRPYKRDYQAIEGEGNCNGKSVSLEELIARQRENLRHTFIQSERSEADQRACQRIAKNERELADATAEFTDGLEQRFGPIPCLHEAQEAMTAASSALEQRNAVLGGKHEETALAGLIKARKNLRQLLKDSKCSSECRKFDNQQKQKLRKPPKKDDKAQRAQLQQEIEKLAREERKLSQEISPKDGGAKLEPAGQDGNKKSPSAQKPNGSSSAGSSGKTDASSGKGSVRDRQEKAAAKAEELQKRVAKDEALTNLARERMDAAAQAAQESARSLREGKQPQASQQADDAAELLERLARQVAGLKAAELTERLAKTQGLTRQLSQQQQKLDKEMQAKPSGAAKPGEGKAQSAGQRGAAEEARTIADLLERLQGDASGTNPQLGEALRQAAESNSPSEIAKQMGRAADALKAGKADAARRDVAQSARGLEALADKLETVRRGLIAPQLSRLIEAEKKAAQAQKALDSANNDREKAAAEKKVADLRESMESLAQKDGKIAEAAEALAESVRRASGWKPRAIPHDPRVGAYVPPIEYTDGLQKVVKVLQARIQEIILKDAMLDRDEAVPVRYKALVEQYYKALSDDLR